MERGFWKEITTSYQGSLFFLLRENRVAPIQGEVRKCQIPFLAVWDSLFSGTGKELPMRKKNYRGVKCTKRNLAKCDEVWDITFLFKGSILFGGVGSGIYIGGVRGVYKI